MSIVVTPVMQQLQEAFVHHLSASVSAVALELAVCLCVPASLNACTHSQLVLQLLPKKV